MSGRITLTLRDDTLEKAKSLARDAKQPVAEYLADSVDDIVHPFGRSTSSALPPVSGLSDGALIKVVDSTTSPAISRRLSELLARQREGRLTPAEGPEIMTLMHAHHEGQMRKAEALVEAVRRGLRGPPEP